MVGEHSSVKLGDLRAPSLTPSERVQLVGFFGMLTHPLAGVKDRIGLAMDKLTI
jgi:hypothetical protein